MQFIITATLPNGNTTPHNYRYEGETKEEVRVKFNQERPGLIIHSINEILTVAIAMPNATPPKYEIGQTVVDVNEDLYVDEWRKFTITGLLFKDEKWVYLDEGNLIPESEIITTEKWQEKLQDYANECNDLEVLAKLYGMGCIIPVRMIEIMRSRLDSQSVVKDYAEMVVGNPDAQTAA